MRRPLVHAIATRRETAAGYAPGAGYDPADVFPRQQHSTLLTRFQHVVHLEQNVKHVVDEARLRVMTSCNSTWR